MNRPDTPQLKAAYHAKEAFFAIYALKTRPAAEKDLADWEAKLTPDLRIAFKRRIYQGYEQTKELEAEKLGRGFIGVSDS